MLGFDLPSEPSYRLVIGTNTGEIIEAPCRGEYWSGTSSRSLLGFQAGRHPSTPPGLGDDPNTRSSAGGILRGMYSRAVGPATIEVSWSICRAGVRCPPLPEPEAPPETPPAGGEEEPPSDCDETRTDRALLDLKLDQQRLLGEQLTSRFDEYSALSRQAEQWKSDYTQAARDCTLTQAAIILTGFLVSNPTLGTSMGSPTLIQGAMPTAAQNALAQFYNFLGLVDKVATGDATWLLPDQSFKEFAKIPNPHGGFLDAEMIYDGLRAALGFLEGHVGASSPESLIDDLRNCGGFTVDPVMDGAIQYLRLLQQIEPLMRQVQETLNRIEDKDEEIFDFCLSHAEACTDYERCR